MAMTLEQVRDWFRTEHMRADGAWWYMGHYKVMANAITAHLTQPAQAVDVGAIREVVSRLRMPGYIGDKDHAALTRALAGEQAGWRDIATAPKDGTVILAAHNRGTWAYPQDPLRINCVVVFWAGDRFRQFGPDSFPERELTRWMPIPTPDKDQR